MSRYDTKTIEPKWQKAWDDADTFRPNAMDGKPKYYVLEMFPYPSGRIHIGHVRNYTMGDVIARYKLATGHNVLAPDGLGRLRHACRKRCDGDLAATRKTGPTTTSATMREQMKPLGLSPRLVPRVRHL